jgi:hypothetical protein
MIRNKLIGSFVSVVMLIACKNKKTMSEQAVASELTGKWSYVSSIGGFTGKMPAWPEGTKVIIEFTKDKTYRRFENGKEMSTARYELKETKSFVTGETATIIDYVADAIDQSYTINGDTLNLRDEVADGFNFVFVKSRR